MLRSLAFTALLLASAAPSMAQDRVTLGYGRLFTNDYIGDGHDRWRTGSYNYSVIRGTTWSGRLPDHLGEILEYRFRSDIIAPMRVAGGTVDRPYASRLSFGVHTQAAFGPVEVSLGGDLVALGPQTGLADLQEWYHDTFGYSGPHGLDSEIDNAIRLTATAEAAWPVHVTETLTLRPFAELQVGGVEDVARVGADLIWGRVGQADLMVRDMATGQLIRAVEGPAAGFALVAGADWTQVGDSLYLPEDQGFAAVDERWRTRLGVHWQMAPKTSFFYGLTYLSEEFEGQEEGQLLGSLKLNFNF